MFILAGCGPLDPHSPICNIYYKAIVNVRFENGDPCPTAYAKTGNHHADSSGTLKISFYERCGNNDPETKNPIYAIYESPEGTKIWEVRIVMIKYNKFSGEWPASFMTIVVPDSLNN